jgi:5'-3' exonuclease
MDGKRNAWEGVNILPFIDSDLAETLVATRIDTNKASQPWKGIEIRW